MDLNNLESDIKRYRQEVELANALERLESNSDFQRVIGNGYLKEHLLTLVLKRHSDPTPDNATSREIDAVSALMAFMGDVKTIGATARVALEESEQSLSEYYKEENR